MTKLQKLLFAALIGGSTQGWGSDLDFTNMTDQKIGQTFLDAAQGGDLENSKNTIIKLFSEKSNVVSLIKSKALQRASRRSASNERDILIALINADGVDTTQSSAAVKVVAVAPSFSRFENEVLSVPTDVSGTDLPAAEEVEEVPAPIPSNRETLIEENEGSSNLDFTPLFDPMAVTPEKQEWINNTFYEAIVFSNTSEIRRILNAPETLKPSAYVIKEQLSNLMEMNGQDENIGILINYLCSTSNTVVTHESSMDVHESMIDPEIQEHLDSDFIQIVSLGNIETLLETLGSYNDYTKPRRSLVEFELQYLQGNTDNNDENKLIIITQLNDYLTNQGIFKK
jgi:hypothetical protein